MSIFTPHPPDLANGRDNAILRHVAKHEISLPGVIHNLFFPGLSSDTPRKVLHRHFRRRLLTQYPLDGNTYYVRLGQAAVSRWGFPRSRVPALGAQKLPYALGALAYTCLDAKPKNRLTPQDLLRRLPWFPAGLLTSWAYVWEENRLGSLRVEHRARPDRVIAKLADQVYRYAAQPEFRELIEQGCFYFVAIAASEYQESALRHEASMQQLNVELQTAHYPPLVRYM